MLTSPPYRVGPGILPVRSFHVSVTEDAFEKFAVRLHQFGASFHFEDKSRAGSPLPHDIVFYMKRNELDLVATKDIDRAVPGIRYSLGFYPKHDRAPPPAENVDGLVDGLKTFLAPVEGLVVTETTKAQP